MAVDAPGTYGALLIGAFVSMLLSGVLIAQVIGYLRMYRDDSRKLKGMVSFIWLLDISHSIFVCASLWDYLVEHYSDFSRADYAPWTVPVTVLLTAILTFIAHSFFAYRIFRLSMHNLYITIPIVILVICRMGSACATTAVLFRLPHYSGFLRYYRWLPTLGLVLSFVVDVFITLSLFFYLGRRRTISSSLDAVIDTLLMYAFETCALTCFATILSTIFWITMPHNLLFLGAYFVVAKLYANSLLVTLVTRKHIRRISMANQVNMFTSTPQSQPRRKSNLSFATMPRPASRERPLDSPVEFRRDSLASSELPASILRPPPPNRAYCGSTGDLSSNLEISVECEPCEKGASATTDVEKQ